MEKIRQKLKERKDFDIGKAFLTLAQAQREVDNGIPQQGSKHILYSDLERVMKAHKHFENLERDDLHLLISRFDRDGDGRIELNEFYEQMEPHSQRKY